MPQGPTCGADPRARAKIPYGTGVALFSGRQSRAVALEELKIAITADSTYAPPTTCAGWSMPICANSGRRTRISEGPEPCPNDPEVNNNYGWYLCEHGKPRQAISYFLTPSRTRSTPRRTGPMPMPAPALRSRPTISMGPKIISDRPPVGGESNLVARIQLAQLFYRKGRLDEAKRALHGETRRSWSRRVPTRSGWRFGSSASWATARAESGFAAQLRSRYPGRRNTRSFEGQFRMSVEMHQRGGRRAGIPRPAVGRGATCRRAEAKG